MSDKILVIDDDEFLLKLIQRLLKPDGYSVFVATSGDKGLKLFHQVAPDLVLLDVMMPEMDGWEVCRRLRQISPVPIIFLTALSSKNYIVDGLVEGADDYLVKPFNAGELRARVTALLRRARMPLSKSEIMRFGSGDLTINRAEKSVFAHGQEVQLSPIEYNLLLFLAEQAGQILSIKSLFDAIWGSTAETGSQSVKWYIWRLRQKIESNPQEPRFILTERGKGYRFSLQ